MPEWFTLVPFGVLVVAALLIITRQQANRYRQLQNRALAQSKAANDAGLALQEQMVQTLKRIADALEKRA